MLLLEISLHPIWKITTSGVSSCIIGLTEFSIYLIIAPINGLNLVLHFFKQELNLFLLMAFTILVPNTMLSDQNQLLHCIDISWDKIFTLFRNTNSISLRKSIYNWCRSSFMYSYIAIYIVVKCIRVFVDIVIHPVIDVRLCCFIFVDNELILSKIFYLVFYHLTAKYKVEKLIAIYLNFS